MKEFTINENEFMEVLSELETKAYDYVRDMKK